MKLIHRPQYEEQLIRYLQVPEIKILKGVRRCGKSSILLLLRQHLLNEGMHENQIFYRSFDEYEVPLTADASWLKEQIDESIRNANDEKTFFVLLDEIQTISGWEDVIRRLYRRENTQIVITGSNAHLLSSDLATYISGRYIEIDIMPLQFSEFCSFCDERGWSYQNEASMFEDFLIHGGMPGLFQFDQEDLLGREKMLSGIFDTVIMNDVALHSRITDFPLLSKLIHYIFSTSGNLFSTKKVADTLSSAGEKTSSETVNSYVAALKDALILNECDQFGIMGKEILRPQRKFYPIDTGLRNLTSGFQTVTDVGFKLENAVYNQLLSRGYKIAVGTLPKAEVDFIAMKGAKRCYYQVCASVLDESVMVRETSALESIDDSFPKVILTLDGLLSGYTKTGIRIESVIDWCK